MISAALFFIGFGLPWSLQGKMFIIVKSRMFFFQYMIKNSINMINTFTWNLKKYVRNF